MEEFPIIHTNFWDALIAVPAIIVLIELLKAFFPKFHSWIPTVANLLGLFISIFIAHPNNLWAGIFMGVFYGNAAIGAYAAFITSLRSYRNMDSHDKYR
ncbi:hypothetical protein [Bacillus sp. NEB1478]|uniref:hypothetical protein n=1 Tax=Bacillus sp. NEB1478 TaxID=3073816 RepID=UPI002873A2A3|nr:hypothetical protein [Bacillus sp. NEB1478]WNB91037.1 hypothetical protein RGB74_14130 [Bacillus sp. NEB1478]